MYGHGDLDRRYAACVDGLDGSKGVAPILHTDYGDGSKSEESLHDALARVGC
jgi:hypothetical protein